MPKLPRIPKECYVLNDSSVTSSVTWLDASSSSLNSTTSSNNNNNSRKRKVRFQVSKFTYIEPDDTPYFPPLLPCELYYTDDEWTPVRMETSLTLKMILAAKDPKLSCGCIDDKRGDFCARGVEELTPEALRRRLVSYLRTLRTVLREQTRQRELGIHDPEAMAEKCRHLSTMNVVRAQNQGIQDAQVAYQIQHGNDDHRDDDEEQEPVDDEAEEDLPSAVLFQKMKHDSFGSIKGRRDSSDTVSTYVTDDLSSRSSFYQDDDDDHQKYNGGGVDRMTILETRPTPIQQIARIFHHKPCWAR